MSSYSIENLDGEKIVALDNWALGALIRSCPFDDPPCPSGLLEGALEMVVKNAVIALHRAA